MAPPPTSDGYQLWEYYPSVAGNIVLATIFGLLTTAHLIFLIKTKKKFCIPLVIGGIFEVAGYAARVIAHWKIDVTIWYAMQSLLILLAPILFAASVYMYLSRIITSVGGERHSIIPIKFLTKVFVMGDITCFFVQGAGGGILSGAKSQSKIDLGQNVILAGLILQIVIFFLFIVVAAIFHVRMRANVSAASATAIPWQTLLAGLYSVSVLIAIRNIFRAVEYATGGSGYLLSHEWCSFVFDAALMIVVLIVCLSWYLNRVDSRNKQRDVEVLTLESTRSAKPLA